MNITKKLCLTLLSVTTVIVVINIALARWSFEQGLNDFMHNIELQRLHRLSNDLIIEYQKADHSWATLTDTDLDQLIRHRERPSSNEEHPAKPPRRPKPHQPQHRPPFESTRAAHENHRRPTKSRPAPKGPPTALYDAKGNFISGVENNDTSQSFSMPIMLNNQRIGELKSWPFIATSSTMATQFSRQQFWTSLFIGLCSLTLAGFISWLVAQKMLKPIRKISAHVARLSQGDYSAKISHKSRDELGILMDNINQLSDTLDKNRTAKNRWFANISHELRTPLTVLQGEIDVLQAGIRPLDMQQVKSFEQEVNLLKRLVDDLYQLSLSDIGGLKYTFTPTKISQCLHDTLDSLKRTAQAKKIKIVANIEPNIVINADKQRIEQLFLNLLSNSIQYTNNEGEIVVHLQQKPIDNQRTLIQLTLNDSAPTLPEADCELMFDPLYRHDTSRKMRDSGAGLGLTICKNIVEAHQGQIQANQSTLGGICMTVTFKHNNPIEDN